MNLLRKLLFPFVPVYYLVTSIRNLLYDYGVKPSKTYSVPIICVGNLSVGGTGKSPMVLYLINMLKDTYNIATLSRGYGRKTRGFLLANNNSTANDLGDEPLQFYNTFKTKIKVAVDANRQNGIETLLSLDNTLDVILLDDAFQHRKVKAQLNILLTSYNALYTNDWLLPTGNLRESKHGAKRAQIIVVTKCPNNLDNNKKEEISNKLHLKNYQSLFFSYIKYSNTIFSKNETKLLSTCHNFCLVTGIANPKPLVDYLESKKLNFNHCKFKDHYSFNDNDVENLSKYPLIITTEKDYMRLKGFKILENKLFYLPITLNIDNAKAFNALITQTVS